MYKPLGMTPLEAIQAFREQHPEYQEKKLGYAGRLDPMAEGLLLVLVDEENKQRKLYEDLPKTYEFTLLPGIATDTYDLLGKITQISRVPESFEDLLKKSLPSYIKTFDQPYPPYSSRTVDGKPLFWWARQDKLHEIIIPTKRVTILSLQLLSTQTISIEQLHEEIKDRIGKVRGNFRQEEILAGWQAFFEKTNQSSLPLYKLSITASSGTYVRSLVHHLGQDQGCVATTYHIKRTSIGMPLGEPFI